MSLAHTNAKKGFTLLELLIVISILVILGLILIFVLNPAETLAKSRDAQRISDLGTMKTALGVFVTTISGSDLDLDGTAVVCLAEAGVSRSGVTGANIAYSDQSVDLCDDVTPNEPPIGADAETGVATFEVQAMASNWCHASASATANTLVDGTGWVPVNLTLIVGGSPISSLPIDPTNSVGAPAAPDFADFVYRYACQNDAPGALPDFVYEFNANLESTAFTVTDNREANDGGDEESLYEVGSSVRLIGNSTTTATEY